MSARLGRAASLSLLLGAVAVAFADSSIVVLALPDLLRQYGSSIGAVSWVVTAYNLVLALASLALVWLARRLDERRSVRIGLALFLAASLACGSAWNLGSLVAFRSAQGLGGALLLVGSLPLVRRLAANPKRGVTLWIAAGVVGTVVGPAAGGLLTELLSWRAVFFAQAPLAAAALVVVLRARRDERSAPSEASSLAASPARCLSANIALALASAALVGVLFLAVVLLVNIWRFSALAAAGIVSAIPLTTFLVQPLAVRVQSRSAAAAGVIALAAGLAGMALLPSRSILWVIASLALAGVGLGVVIPTLSRIALAGDGAGAAPGAWNVAARHVGLVVGLLIVTPLLTSDLSHSGQRAKLQATSAVLDAPLAVQTKLQLAFSLAPVLSRPASKGLPDFTNEIAKRHIGKAAGLGRELDSIVQAAFTRGFRRSFLVTGLLGLLALFPFAFALPAASRRPGWRTLTAPALALLAATSLLAAETARGALSYGSKPRLYAACAARTHFPGHGIDATSQRLALSALDRIACHYDKSREELVVNLAAKGADSKALLSVLEFGNKELSALSRWLSKL
jgi:predicted MFS family arabinose efflux permease